MAEVLLRSDRAEPVRSLHVISSDARRGAETYAAQLTAALNARGHVAVLRALVPSGDANRHDVAPLGPSRRSTQTIRALRAAAEQFDVVVAHGSSTLEACVVGLAGRSTPFVYRTIGDPGYWVSSRLRRRAVGRMLRRARQHVALWSGAAAQLSETYRVPSRDIHLIPNAVPGDAFSITSADERARARAQLDVPEGARCLAFVGALSAEKNVRAAIEACAASGSTLLVAGDGPDSSSLREYASRVARHQVRFLGPVKETTPLYAACDLLLLPSRSEGMPAVIIEAGLSGRASVASSVGGIPQMVVDGSTGYLAKPGDDAHFVRVVCRALSRSDDSVGLRAAAQFREAFTLEATVERWEAALAAAANRPREATRLNWGSRSRRHDGDG